MKAIGRHIILEMWGCQNLDSVQTAEQALREMVDATQRKVTGDVRVKLYRGNVLTVGRRSPYSLYSEKLATFEADSVYNQRDAEGFIKLNALRLRQRNRGNK